MVSFATDPIEGNASPRKPSVSIAIRSSPSSFDVAWRSTAEREIVPAHAAAIVRDPDQPPAAAVGHHLDPAGAGIEGVFHEFLHGAGRPLHHLAGGDAVDQAFGKLTDGHWGPTQGVESHPKGP